MEKRALLAIVLSILVLLGYQMYAGRHYPQPVDAELQKTQDPGPKTHDLRSTTPSLASPLPSIKEEETVIETERFIITFTNIGGAIKKIELKDYPDQKTEMPLVLASVEDPKYGIGNISDLHAIPGSDLHAYSMAGYGRQITSDGRQITYRYGMKDNNGIEITSIEKTYTVHNSLNHIELDVKIKNSDGRQITSDYGIIAASGIDTSGAFASRYIEVNSKINGRVLKDKRTSSRPGEVSWVALKNKYFAIILKPYQFGSISFTKRIEKENLLSGLTTARFTVPAQSEISHRYVFYIGPADTNLLKKYGLGLEEVVDYGMFGGISILLMNILRFFHRIFHNWGVSVLCVTFLINLVLSPLTRKSYQSMKQMQELQPHMDKLREIHKDNPSKLQKEMMELYRRYKVNPLGGCLPLLLQMPIIFAMYQTVMRSLELKGANFLWIKDLSGPDAVPLPFSLPLFGNSINVLPLLMVAAMVIQQKISPMSKGRGQSEQQKQQQQMMLLMPIVFGVLFYGMPSGLVLYWLINTVLMMVNQHRVMKANPAIVGGR